jgi:hypothetical protein
VQGTASLLNKGQVNLSLKQNAGDLFEPVNHCVNPTEARPPRTSDESQSVVSLRVQKCKRSVVMSEGAPLASGGAAIGIRSWGFWVVWHRRRQTCAPMEG